MKSRGDQKRREEEKNTPGRCSKEKLRVGQEDDDDSECKHEKEMCQQEPKIKRPIGVQQNFQKAIYFL